MMRRWRSEDQTSREDSFPRFGVETSNLALACAAGSSVDRDCGRYRDDVTRVLADAASGSRGVCRRDRRHGSKEARRVRRIRRAAIVGRCDLAVARCCDQQAGRADQGLAAAFDVACAVLRRSADAASARRPRRVSPQRRCASRSLARRGQCDTRPACAPPDRRASVRQFNR